MTDSPAAATIPELFEAQAARSPAAAAVRHGAASLTYRQLDMQSNRVARSLIALGAGPERVVAVAVRSSETLVIALLGVLKAGAAYLPLDADGPSGRMMCMLHEARPLILLLDAQSPGRLQALPIPRITLDSPATVQALEAMPAGRVTDAERTTRLAAGNAAYIIYTSGSTGRPKGVIVEHGNLSNYCCWARDTYRTGLSTISPVHSSIVFDLGVTSLFPPLLAGGTLMMVSDRGNSIGDVSDLIANEGPIAPLKLTPSHMRVIRIPAASEQHPPMIIVAGGEPLPSALASAWIASGHELYNEYGPTECTVGCIAGKFEMSGYPQAPIGRPIENTAAFVLDSSLRHVPAASEGELYIAGAGVSRGYLGDPGLTSSRFVACPFLEGGTRMYRTGDVVQRQSDGTLFFVGRTDDQVKVHGYRLELGEVEAVLNQARAVSQAAVVVRQDTPGSPRLAAYIVYASEMDEDPVSLREHAVSRLPSYMVPSVFVAVSELPLTANGKVARAVLAGEEYAPRPDAGILAPTASRTHRRAADEAVAAVWRKVLDRPVAMNDDFFTVGGSSLLAIMMSAQVGEALAVPIPPHLIFNASTLADFSAAVESRVAGYRPIRRTDREGWLPLSSAQRRIWLHEVLLGAGPSPYHMARCWQLGRPVDAERLAAALEKVSAQHEALRLVIRDSADGPQQRVLSPDAMPIPLEMEYEIDPNDLSEVLRRSGERPFDLTSNPPLRATLVTTWTGDDYLLLVAHHIAFDAVGMECFLSNLAAAYCDPTGYDSAVPETGYLDFLAEIDAESEEAREADMAFWRAVLADAPMPRWPHLANHGNEPVAEITLDHNIAASVEKAAVMTGATVAEVLMAALAAAACCHAALPDVTLGTVSAGRERSEAWNIVGNFANPIAVRVQLHGTYDFRHMIYRAKKAHRGAIAHRRSAFDDVVRELDGPTGRLGRVAITFAYQGAISRADETLTIADISATEIPLIPEVALADLDVRTFRGADGEIRVMSICSEEQMDPPRMHALLASWVRMLEVGCADLDDTDWRLAATDAPVSMKGPTTPVKGTICDMIRAAATMHSDSLALQDDDSGVSYAELVGNVSLAAHRLRSEGFRVGDRVAVVGSNRITTVTAVLAVMWAGCPCVLIDEDLPQQRIRFMLDLAQPLAIVSSEPRPGTDFAAWLDIDELSRNAGGTVTEPAAGAEDAAYLIFTSGSTGPPRLAEITHAGLVNCAEAQRQIIGVNADDIVLQAASLGFDLWMYEMILALCSGALLRIVAERHLTGDRLMSTLRSERISIATLVPSALAGIDPALLPDVRTLIVAGEAFPISLAADWADGPTRVINAYGPTETSIWATYSDVRNSAAAPPIGVPIINTKCMVTDPEGHAVPAGVPGELVLAGAGIGHGYINDARRTAASFVPCPGERPGERVYRTGDIVVCAGEKLDYLGRIDEQVKLRGFRIDPGEVEATLARHHAVSQAAVVVREDRIGDKRLVGYVVPHQGSAIDPSAVRRFAAELLPFYMVPAVETIMELPHTPSGKLDRRALPAPAVFFRPRGRRPGNVYEEILCEILADLLGLKSVGADESFFELGGHSLLAVKAVSRIQSVFDIELPADTLFRDASAARLACTIEEFHGNHAVLAQPPAQPLAAQLSPWQQRLWTWNDMARRGSCQHIHSATRIQGALNVVALSTALADVVARHEILRTTYPMIDGTAHQRLLDANAASVLLVARPPRDDLLSFLADAADQRFDLTCDLPIRAHLAILNENEYALLVVIHRIACDETSIALFRRDLSEAYQARLSNLEPSWTPLSLQFSDYTSWRNGGAAAANGDRPLTPMRPLEHHRGAGDGDAIRRDIDAVTYSGLITAARKYDATLSMIIESAASVLLSSIQAGDVGVTLVRTASERSSNGLIAEAIGNFSVTYEVQTERVHGRSLRELLRRVRDANLSAYQRRWESAYCEPGSEIMRDPAKLVIAVVMEPEEFSDGSCGIVQLPGLRCEAEPLIARAAMSDAAIDLRLAVAEDVNGKGLVIKARVPAGSAISAPPGELLRRLAECLREFANVDDCGLNDSHTMLDGTL